MDNWTIAANVVTLQDIVTDVEIISDIWDMKEVDGIVYEADVRSASNRDDAFSRSRALS